MGKSYIASTYCIFSFPESYSVLHISALTFISEVKKLQHAGNDNRIFNRPISERYSGN